MVPKTVRKGKILDFEETLSKVSKSLNKLVTSKRFVDAIIVQNNIKPI
jgi:hypothetical protein